MTDPNPERRSPTVEQAEALGVSGASVALSAGAGCGKTFVLAERFVRALEAPDGLPLSRVVALTFTNKAARELRDRIRKECRERLDAGSDPGRWRAVLRGLVGARIGTFHAFCGEVLRRHAVEAGVDPGFDVLDEPIAMAIRDEALASSLRDRLSARDPDLFDLAVEFGLGTVRRSLDDLLGNRSAGDVREWAEKSPDDLLARWREIWDAEVRPALMAGFVAEARPCLDLLDGEGFEDAKFRGPFDAIREAFDRFPTHADPCQLLETIHALAKVKGLPTAKLWPSSGLYEQIKGHFDRLRKRCEKLGEALLWDETTSRLAAEFGLRFARLAVRARESYDRAKRERGGVDNDDLLLLTRDLLARGAGSVREALASSVDLVLVDEFQDTDPIQAEILDHLAGPDALGGKLFLVGDFKQSIYRFRGANPGLFRDYRERFPEAGRKSLSANFRSVPEILRFVNALFAETFPEADSALRPGREFALDVPPAVEFLWGPAEEGQKSAPKPDANLRRRDEARRLAAHLRRRLDEGWMIRVESDPTRLRRADAGDVAILFRSLSDASEYERALAEVDLDYHVVGGSGFFAQQEVLDLINVLTAVEDPLDPVSFAGALRSPFFSVSDEGLYWIANARKGWPHAGLEQDDALENLTELDRAAATRARRLLADWRSVKDRLPIAGLVDRILSDSGYEAALVGEPLGDRKRANARKLVRMARRFDEQGGFTLADFVARLRADLRAATKETQAATTDELGEIVRLMSIHQAKGLEFPIVVLPDLDRKRPGELDRVAFDPDLGPLVNPVVDPSGAEEGEAESGGCLGWMVYRHRERVADDAEALRLFYVAATRARDALVLSSATAPDKPPVSPALALLDRRFDRITGALNGPPPDGRVAPRVRVVPASDGPASSPPHAPRRIRARPLEVAATIRGEANIPDPGTSPARKSPRSLDLDPSLGLSSTDARLDRLVRTILADPKALATGRDRLEPIADRSARLQDPVAPRRVVVEAVDRVVSWSRSPLAVEISRSAEVARSFEWSTAWPSPGGPIAIRGSGDLLFRDKGGDACLVQVGLVESAGPREWLRLLLAARAAGRLGLGAVCRGWWVGLGPEGRLLGFDRFDDAEVDRAIAELDVSGP